jgi:hypothetical protein
MQRRWHIPYLEQFMLIRWQQAGVVFARRRTSECDACTAWCTDICAPAARGEWDAFKQMHPSLLRRQG